MRSKKSLRSTYTMIVKDAIDRARTSLKGQKIMEVEPKASAKDPKIGKALTSAPSRRQRSTSMGAPSPIKRKQSLIQKDFQRVKLSLKQL